MIFTDISWKDFLYKKFAISIPLGMGVPNWTSMVVRIQMALVIVVEG